MGSNGMAQNGDSWNETAKLYKTMTFDVSSGCIGVMLKRADALLPWSQATAILDNGCGPGPVTLQLIEKYGSIIPKEATFTASDFSPGMVEQVKTEKENRKGDPLWDKLQTKQLNAMDMQGIADNTFSHITAGWVYFMVPEPHKAMSESYRILKPGGVLSLSSWQGNQWMDVMFAIGSLRPDRSFPDWNNDWKHCEGIEGEFKRAGFKDFGAEEVTVSMDVESPEYLAGLFMRAMPPLKPFMQDFSDEEKEKAKQLMADKTRELLARSPGKLTGTAIVGWGRK